MQYTTTVTAYVPGCRRSRRKPMRKEFTMLLRSVVLSLTGLAGVMLVEQLFIRRMKCGPWGSSLLISIYFCAYWGLVYVFFLEG